jgi:putative addiction module killer protein
VDTKFLGEPDGLAAPVHENFARPHGLHISYGFAVRKFPFNALTKRQVYFTLHHQIKENDLLKPGNYEVVVFEDRSGEKPYLKWLERLEWKTQERISARVMRMLRGQFGDYKALAGGLYELRLFFGPGYRVYFGEYGGRVVLILNGGDKSSQQKDINRAKEYWNKYLEDNS